MVEFKKKQTSKQGDTAESGQAKSTRKRPRDSGAIKGSREIAVQMTDDGQNIRALAPLRAITIYGAARILGIRASVASQLLCKLESKGLLKKVGGYSGRYVYSVISKS